ncbi:MAG: hypothetical protein HY291_00630 [Planctomycetes bacterium]|nr:hypothetical protein [Planctomycetota bacterium]
MPTYKYEAMDAEGREAKGQLEAASEDEAKRQLADLKLYPTLVTLVEGREPAATNETEGEVEILLDAKGGVLRPGQTLSGGYRLNTAYPVPVKRMELSVLWYTMGKGDTDEGVIHFETVAENQELDARRAFAFSVPLPDAPWSYDGKIVKILWAVRVRVFPVSGAEIATEEGFRLIPERATPKHVSASAE